MLTLVRKWILLLGVVVAAQVWVFPASADGPQSATASNVELARTHYQRGVELFGEGDYNLALIEFLRSNELVPSWRVSYNVGLVHFELGHFAAASRALEDYLREGGDSISPERRTSVLGELASLKLRTSRLSVTVNVPDAEVRFGDTSLGAAPIQGRLVDAGFRDVTVSKQGFVTARQSLTLAGGEDKRLNIVLKAVDVVAPAESPRSHTSLWVAWGVTGALLVGTVGVGIAGYSADSDLDALKTQRNVTRAELDSKNSSVRTLTVTRNILGGASILSIGIATYLTIREFSLRGNKQASAAPLSALSSVWVGPNSFGVLKEF